MHFNHKLMNTILKLIFFLSLSIMAQTPVSIVLQKNSKLSISGTTNAVGFKLYQEGEKFFNKNINCLATKKQNKIVLSSNNLNISVKNFNSVNKMALQDFLELIKAEKYPNLTIEVHSLELFDKTNKEADYIGTADVTIGIAGATKNYCVPIVIDKKGEFFETKIQKRLSILDFGLKPRKYMFGIIILNEWIDIDFNLICSLN